MPQSTTMTRWLDELVDAAKRDEIDTTSAGGGPERGYAYLHYRSRDGRHSTLVFRHTDPGDEASVLALRFDGDDEEIAEKVARATEKAVADFERSALS